MTDKIDAPSCPFNGAASTPKEGDAEWHGAQMDFRNSMSYGDYLALDRILTAQHPLSPNHNEMLTTDFQLALDDMAIREVNLRWQAEMGPFFESLEGRRPDQGMLVLEEVFHLD